MIQFPESVRCPDCGTDLVSEPGIPGLCPQCLLSLALKESPRAAAASAEGDGGSGPDAVATLDRLSAGRILGERYQIRELLGRGGMGEVFRAFDLKLRVDVALKAVRAERAESERGREQLRQEVRSAREVVSPNVCRIFDLVAEDGQELVSMEFIDGTTLGETLKERGPLSLQEAREVASQFLAGLEAIHQAGLVHRDFKPENVMLTRAGRVVVMDFGLAKARTEGRTGTISGTPAYMAPEQARGDSLDARADVFAAGVVLAEMLSVGGSEHQSSRQSLWRAIRETPPRVADGPWAAVLRQALAPNPDERPTSARVLARALEEVTQRLPGFETRRPYPGLSSFTEADAEYFHGRELETEAVWKKLKRPRLLALIGPSGAGKSSFLRAGLLATLPKTWKAVLAKPGTRPFQALAQALAPHLAGDAQAVQDLPRFEDPDVSVALVAGWRRRHDNALVIVDQFEELFTQNPRQVQAEFAKLLGRLVLEADAHVILSLRDDFLIHCHAHEPLAPILSELTLLGPLNESGLRRALLQPALACGYRFESEALVEEMVAAVKGERGALPLLAFAASRLWDLRDRERGLLTSEACREIGGVAGALAQHAEATLERIGTPRAPLVRELFQNLVTAQGTRAVRERGELLSVFAGPAKGAAADSEKAAGPGDAKTHRAAAPGAASAETPTSGEVEAKQSWSRGDAEGVLDTLIDARLLTSYERAGEGGEGHQQVEIVHESLLGAWPRLVRWQTQDADGAQLRDQLRQAAQAWHDRGQPEDLLWTGSAYRDFAVWRERYRGGLSATEQAFAHAASHLHGRRRRRRRIAVAAVMALAAAVATTMSLLWRESELSRQRAEAQARQREAAELLALGRLRLEEHPTAALAHAIASLERADNAPARRFAVEALWTGPPARYFTAPGGAAFLTFSADGEWLAATYRAGLELWPRDGGPAIAVSKDNRLLGFTADSRLFLTCVSPCQTLNVRSVPDGSLRRTIAVGPFQGGPLCGTDAVVASVPRSGISTLFRIPPLEGEPVDIGSMDSRGLQDWGCDRSGRWFVEVRASGDLLVRSLEAFGAPARRLGRHEGAVWFDWAGAGRVATNTPSGEVRIWNLAGEGGNPERILRAAPDPLGRYTGPYTKALPDPSGTLVAILTPYLARLRDLDGPPDAEPVPLSDRLERGYYGLPALGESWIAVPRQDYGVLWPLRFRQARVLRRPGPPSQTTLAFSPDGRYLFSHSKREVRAWPLSPEAGPASRAIYEAPDLWGDALDADPRGRFVVAPGRNEGVAVVPLAGGVPQMLKGEGIHWLARVDPQGRRLAAYSDSEAKKTNHLYIWDLETGQATDLDPRAVTEDCAAGYRQQAYQWEVGFLPDGTLFSDGFGGLRLWNLERKTSRALRPCDPASFRSDQDAFHGFTLSRDGRFGVRVLSWQDPTAPSIVTVVDLAGGKDRTITSHGNRVFGMAALDPTGRILVTGDKDGLVRAGPVTGEEPHLLYGHTADVTGLAVSPDGTWIASASMDGTIRLWPMPEGQPLHALPYEELLAKLRSLTNLRVVPDANATTGYKLEPGPFPGWAKAPEW